MEGATLDSVLGASFKDVSAVFSGCFDTRIGSMGALSIDEGFDIEGILG